MHKIQGWTGLRAAVIALGLVAWTATGATAAPLVAAPLSYTTSGQVDTTAGVTGTNVISYVPLSSGSNSVDLSSGQTNVGLGNFVISPLAAGVTTTYSNTPIQISFMPASYGSTSVNSDAPVVISGVLNGVVSGPSSSTVTATLNPPNGFFSLGGSSSANFSLPTSTLLLAPSTSNNGTTSVQGLAKTSNASESPVPEPSTIALFLTTVGGLGLRRYVLSRRRPATV